MLCFPHLCHQQLRQAVERAYPEEGCGIMLGLRHEVDDEVARLIPCVNASPEPMRRFSISPEDLVAAQRQARAEELEILGFYHSHPDHPAEASPSDLGEAQWTGCVYMICAVESGVLAAISAARLTAPQQWETVRILFAPPDSDTGEI